MGGTARRCDIDAPITLVDLAGTAALLLWGVHMVQTGVQRAFGARLRAFLARTLRTRARALLAGIGVTALLQSSTATGLMVAGFAAEGLVELAPALAAMLGANIGTTLIVQLVSFRVAELAPALILVGVLLFRRGRAALRDSGRVFIGLGLLLMALGQFVSLLTPYEDVPSIRLLLGAVAGDPVLDVLVGAALAWAAHSSVAIVLLAMGFAQQGTVAPDAALALVVGANLGTALNPLLEGTGGRDPVARRVPLGNLLTRVAGVLLTLPLMGPIGRLAVTFEPDPARAVADFHTAFNVVLALLFFPLLGPVGRLLRRLLPPRVDADDPARPRYLDEAALATPVVALGHATREALRLADMVGTMLEALADGLAQSDRARMTQARRTDRLVERLDAAIKDYVAAIDADAMSDDDEHRAEAILTFGINMQLAAGVLDRDLLATASRRARRLLPFPVHVEADLRRMIEHLERNVQLAASVLVTGDAAAARALLAEKAWFRETERAAIAAHFSELRARARQGAPVGSGDEPDAGGPHLELMSDLRRFNTYLVAAAAYLVLDRDEAAAPEAG